MKESAEVRGRTRRGPDRYEKLTLSLGHKQVHFRSGAEIHEGVVHAFVTLQPGLQQAACMLLGK